MPHTHVVTGRGTSGLDVLTRHLWLPLLDGDCGRVIIGPSSGDGWHTLHTFIPLPSWQRPRLLVSQADGPALVRALTSHRSLRSRAARMGRAMGAAVLSMPGRPLSRSTVSVQARDPELAKRLEPVTRMEDVLVEPLLAVLGVRQGANGKATLQLFDRTGRARGYAKVAWSPLTSHYVRTETEVLSSSLSLSTGVRAPDLLARGLLAADRPFLVTRPLPQTARSLTRGEDLSIRTLTTLFPVVRRAHARDTGQFHAVRDRLSSAHRSTRDEELHGAASDLARRIESSDTTVPVLARWHGDLVPWNCAQDADGTVWLWDWESSERDAVAGLDVLHWFLNTYGAVTGSDEPAALRLAADRATTSLQALGMGPDQRAVVAAAYALTKAERYWTLAAANGGWGRNRIGRAATLRILATGQALLASGRHEGE